MKKYLAFYCATVAAFATTLAFAQLSSTGAGKKASPAAAYAGPGDIVAGATAWYGLRAYSTADRGNRLLNVCNVADVACADLSSDATTGALVIGTIGGSSCSNVTCTIKTMYDRSGNGNDITQATIGTRPTLVVSCVNSLPCSQFSGSQFLSGSSISKSQPITISTVAIRTGSFSAFSALVSLHRTGDVTTLDFFSSANNASIYSGSVLSAAALDNAWHALQGIFNGGSSAVNVNNSVTSGAAGSGGTDGGIAFGANPTFLNDKLTGKITEGGYWPIAFSAGNQTAMCNNQFTYWGTSVSC